MKKETQITLVKSFFIEKVYDYLNTGSLDPIEVKIPYRVYRTGSQYQWEATPPTGKIISPKFTDYEKCLSDCFGFQSN